MHFFLLIFENYLLAPECSPLLLDSGTLLLFCFLLFLPCLVCCYKDPEVDFLSQDKDAVFLLSSQLTLGGGQR